MPDPQERAYMLRLRGGGGHTAKYRGCLNGNKQELPLQSGCRPKPPESQTALDSFDKIGSRSPVYGTAEPWQRAEPHRLVVKATPTPRPQPVPKPIKTPPNEDQVTGPLKKGRN
jgi:hypothetical protein